MKPIETDAHNFKRSIKDGYTYVDKTSVSTLVRVNFDSDMRTIAEWVTEVVDKA